MLLKDPALRARMGEARRWRAGRDARFTVERMVERDDTRCYERALVWQHARAAGTARRAAARLKPQAFIMPTWQSEKSNRTGSAASIARSDAVISAAIFQPGLV